MGQNICIDGTLMTRRYFGVGAHRYLVNLLCAMEKVSREGESVNVRVLIPSHDELQPDRFLKRPGFEYLACAPMRLRKIWKLGMFMLIAKRLHADAVFLPFPFPIYYKPLRLAVTVHDVIPLLFPSQYRSPTGLLLRHSFASSLRHADLIFTDSDHSKADMVGTWRLPPERIVVSHLGYDSDLFRPASQESSERPEVLPRYGITQPYILHVGCMEPRKNMVRLVQAYRVLTDRRRDLAFQLVLSGRLAWGADELLRLVHEPSLEGKVILTGPVPDRDLATLYRAAVGYAMPSLYEGFGLPLVEAMACGTPVISSNRSCLPEVAGDAALYFNPESLDEIAGTMERLLTDTGLRKQLIDRGLERVKTFSWEACARTTLAALKNL